MKIYKIKTTLAFLIISALSIFIPIHNTGQVNSLHSILLYVSFMFVKSLFFLAYDSGEKSVELKNDFLTAYLLSSFALTVTLFASEVLFSELSFLSLFSIVLFQYINSTLTEKIKYVKA